MNHPFFFLSIAALAPFYSILILSLLWGFIRSHYEDGSDKTPKNPTPPRDKRHLSIKPVFFAHWVIPGDSAMPGTFSAN